MLRPVHFQLKAPTETTNGTDESKKDRVYASVHVYICLGTHGRAKITKRFSNSFKNNFGKYFDDDGVKEMDTLLPFWNETSS